MESKRAPTVMLLVKTKCHVLIVFPYYDDWEFKGLDKLEHQNIYDILSISAS